VTPRFTIDRWDLSTVQWLASSGICLTVGGYECQRRIENLAEILDQPVPHLPAVRFQIDRITELLNED
jgi:hypothetical protein